MSLFQAGRFTLASGKTSNFKIECDALTPEDWDGLAMMAVDLFGHPSDVTGVPRGGEPFAKALEAHYREGAPPWIVDDVLTTGGSINDHRQHIWDLIDQMDLAMSTYDPVGVVVFARGKKPDWVKAIFSMPDWDEADLGMAKAMIKEKDLHIDVFRNSRECAVRITHMPSGFVEDCGEFPDYTRNKKKAISNLIRRLQDQK